jgi:hypothetical protein
MALSASSNENGNNCHGTDLWKGNVWRVLHAVQRVIANVAVCVEGYSLTIYLDIHLDESKTSAGYWLFVAFFPAPQIVMRTKKAYRYLLSVMLLLIIWYRFLPAVEAQRKAAFGPCRILFLLPFR